MSVLVISTNYSGQTANVTLYSSTGNTIPYTSANSISLGTQTLPFTYSSSTVSNEYGVFSCFFISSNKTCTTSQVTPPDGDGNVYKTIKIGNQIWMSENLRTTKFRDGTPLDNVTSVSDSDWSTADVLNKKYWALVNGTTANTQTYGLVYNQYAVTGSTQGSANNVNLCPSGWHVPTSDEFFTLHLHLTTATPSAPKLKSTTLWGVEFSSNGTNSSGFNATPAGVRLENGSWYGISDYTGWWTTVAQTNWQIPSDDVFASSNDGEKIGFCVRCIKDS